MRRWHDETAVMSRRWKLEMGIHGYDWRCPPTDPSACHCVTGIGYFRKRRVARFCHCGWCFPEQFYPARRSNLKREAIRFEEEAYGS